MGKEEKKKRKKEPQYLQILLREYFDYSQLLL